MELVQFIQQSWIKLQLYQSPCIFQFLFEFFSLLDPGGKMNADLDPQFRHCRSNGTWSKMLRDRKCETGQMRREMEKRRRETVDYRLEDRRQKTGDGWQEKGNLSPVKWERGSNRCEGEKNWVFLGWPPSPMWPTSDLNHLQYPCK